MIFEVIVPLFWCPGLDLQVKTFLDLQSATLGNYLGVADCLKL